MRLISTSILLASLLAFLPIPPAQAGDGNFEIAAGAYVAGSGFVGDDAAFSLRGGYRFTDRWGLQGNVSRVELFGLYSPIVDVDGHATFFDLSAQFFITPGRRAELFVYGGIGMAQFDAGRGHGPGFGFTVEDDFTTHLGLGVNIRLNKHMYLRPDLRTRWLSSFDSGGTADLEPSIGLGWRF